MEIDTDRFNLISKLERNYELADYIDLFSNLHTNKQNGKSAPHKAIMLLSVIDLISSQHITTNEIIYNEELEKCFLKNWKRYVKEVSIFKPKAATPFWHLNSEPFWQLIPYEGGYMTIVKLQKGNPYSAGTIRKYIKYAVIDKELFLLWRDARIKGATRSAGVLRWLHKDLISFWRRSRNRAACAPSICT